MEDVTNNNPGEVAARVIEGAEKHPDTPPPVDLAALAQQLTQDKPFKLEFKHPITKQPLGQFVYLLSQESATVQAYLKENLDAQWREEDALKRRNEDKDPVTVAEIEKRAIGLLCVACVGWENVSVEPNVKQSEFNITNVRKLFAHKFWRQQANTAMENLQNFI